MVDKPKFNALIPELYCTDIKVSVAFYTQVLGFTVLYERPEATFAMMERQGAQIMLDQVVPDSARSWLTAPLEKPFGRGINFEIHTDDAAVLCERVKAAGATLFLPLEEKWYRADDVDLGVRQFIVLDPDGYMLRFSESLGTRPA